MKLTLIVAAASGLIALGCPLVHADDYDGGRGAASDLNEATRQAGQSYRKYLPTWAGGKAINDQNKENDKQFQEDDSAR